MPKQNDFTSRLLVGITGPDGVALNGWEDKLKEIEKFAITKAALFVEFFGKAERLRIYEALKASPIKSLPLVHIRNDMDRSELDLLSKKYGTACFTIHEDSYKVMEKWRGFYKSLFLEMNYDNFVPRSVDVKKIGGFCVDLSHFKAGEEKWSKDFEYVARRRNYRRYFLCNHLNGYSPERNSDIHTVGSLKDFDYLKTLPAFLFGRYIALEMFNSITEQIEFMNYLPEFLNDHLNSSRHKKA